MSDTAKFLNMQRRMRKSFDDIVRDPMNLNTAMSHIANMSTAIEALLQHQIGDQPFFEEHMEMLNVPIGVYNKPQVSNLEPWRKLGQTIKPGLMMDLASVPPENLFFWSDLHYGHNNIIRFTNRPFENLDVMHQQLLDNFKSVVTPNDVVVWVGDISFKSVDETNNWLKQFPGYNILVVGNHDIEKGKLKAYDFQEIHTSILFDNNIVTHHPWHHELPDGFNNIHGHMHNNPCDYPRHFNVSVEVVDYKPISYKHILSKL